LKDFSSGQKPGYIIPVPGVYWVVESYGILLVSPDGLSFLKLDQTESALWQMLDAGIDLKRILRFLSVIKGVSLDEAENQFKNFCKGLGEQGYLKSSGI
jgi:hypothetical protein